MRTRLLPPIETTVSGKKHDLLSWAYNDIHTSQRPFNWIYIKTQYSSSSPTASPWISNANVTCSHGPRRFPSFKTPDAFRLLERTCLFDTSHNPWLLCIWWFECCSRVLPAHLATSRTSQSSPLQVVMPNPLTLQSLYTLLGTYGNNWDFTWRITRVLFLKLPSASSTDSQTILQQIAGPG